jgi:hypothetical protein
MRDAIRHYVHFAMIADLCKKPVSERTSGEVKILVNWLSQMKFFKQRSLNEKVLLDLVSQMNFQTSPKGKIELRYGDFANTFYIILKGQVSVWVPCDIITVENAIS